MKFFCKNNVFIRKVMVIIFLVIIILLLIIGRFRTMRVKMVGLEEGARNIPVGTAQLLGKGTPLFL